MRRIVLILQLRGKGVLEGNGAAWWRGRSCSRGAAEDLSLCGMEWEGAGEKALRYRRGCAASIFIRFINCRDVLLEDFTVKGRTPMDAASGILRKRDDPRCESVFTEGPNTDGLKSGFLQECAGGKMYLFYRGRLHRNQFRIE